MAPPLRLGAPLLAVGLVLAAAPAPPTETVTVVRAGRLFDSASAKLVDDVTIVVRGRTIEKVLAKGEALPSGPGVRVIDLSRATVLPGLIDAHTHLFLQGEIPEEGGYDAQLLKSGLALRAARATASARRALEQGFTTIRDLGTEGAGYGDLGIRDAVEAGYVPGPRIFTSGRAISTTGGYPLYAGYAPELVPGLPKGVQLADGPVEARKAAREHLAEGVDWIKVYMTHRSWVDEKGNLATQPTFTVEELRAIVDEAHGQGHKVACHAYGGEGLKRGLEGGCDSIEHGLDLDEDAVQRMVKQGTWLVPTLAVYYEYWEPADTPAGKRDRKRVEVHGPSFRRAIKAGVKIAFGSDIGGIPWSEPIAQEFERMVELGMPAAEALRCATARGAELLGKPGELGVVAAGARADLIAVPGDPTADIRVMKDVRFVMKNGAVFKDDFK